MYEKNYILLKRTQTNMNILDSIGALTEGETTKIKTRVDVFREQTHDFYHKLFIATRDINRAARKKMYEDAEPFF